MTMPRSNILDNPGFRIAILDVNRKTAEIALSYGISESHCRALRARYGRRWIYTESYGIIPSKRWLDNPDIVSDVRTLRVKEMMDKYGWSNETITEMRRELGIMYKQIVNSKAFHDAIKTHTPKEVAAIFGVSLPTVCKFRKKLRVARTGVRVFRHQPAFKKALRSRRSSTDIAKEFGCSSAWVRKLRIEMKGK